MNISIGIHTFVYSIKKNIMTIKKMLITLSLFILINSCAKKEAILEVVNETDCIYKFYEGETISGKFLGNIGANQTKSFSYMHDNEVINKPYKFEAEPSNCPNTTLIQKFSLLLYSEETRTIRIK